MQSYCTYGDENLMCLGSIFMPRQGNVIIIFQQFVHKTLNCIEGANVEGDDDPTMWLNLWQRKPWRTKIGTMPP